MFFCSFGTLVIRKKRDLQLRADQTRNYRSPVAIFPEWHLTECFSKDRRLRGWDFIGVHSVLSHRSTVPDNHPRTANGSLAAV
jgi:hypothetical protein